MAKPKCDFGLGTFWAMVVAMVTVNSKKHNAILRIRSVLFGLNVNQEFQNNRNFTGKYGGQT
jgi:hypothetical protein